MTKDKRMTEVKKDARKKKLIAHFMEISEKKARKKKARLLFLFVGWVILLTRPAFFEFCLGRAKSIYIDLLVGGKNIDQSGQLPF